MRIKHAIFAGVVAALASSPVPAKNFDIRNSDIGNSGAKPRDEPQASSSCSALQQTADGNWARLPCQELGSPPQGPHKSAARSPDQQMR
jgi:hypothetical protein